MNRDHEAHLSADALARWVDGTVSAEERPAMEAHLAECLTCQEETAAVLALRRHAAPSRRVWRIAVPLAAAAGLALALLTPALDRHPAPVHRAPPPLVSPVLTPIAPVAGARTGGPLIWSRVDGADRYRVTVFDSAGSPLWQETTRDTTVVLTTERLTAGARHHWKVEARLGIDRWTASPLADFVFAPGPAR